MPQITDWLAQSYVALANQANPSRAVNMFAEVAVQDAKSQAPVSVWGTPGSAGFALCGNGPVMGFTLMQGSVYAITAAGLYRIDDNGVTTFLGAAPISPSQVSVDNNGVDIVWVDGQVGYWYSVATGVQKIVDPNFFPSNTVTYFDTYFCYVKNGTRQFFLGPQNAVIPFDPLLQATKEATSDNLLAIANSHEQLYLFGQQRTEVWFDAGNPPPTFPFQRSDGAIIQRGCAAPYSIVLEDNTIFFLGDDLMFYRLDGFKPARLSDHGVEAIWAKFPTVSDAKALVYTVFGHKMVTITFPSAGRTFVVDLATQRWHERESWLSNNADSSIGRWRANCAIYAYNRILLGDSQSGRVDQISLNLFQDFGQTMRGLIVGPPIHNNRKRVFIKKFELLVDAGVGITPGPADIEEQYCSLPVQIVDPVQVTSSAPLSGVGATFATAFLSTWVSLPEDGGDHGVWWSNQTDDDTPGTGGLQIGIFNTESSSVGFQIVVRAWDAGDAAIVSAHYAFTSFASWVWVGVSIDAPNNVLQVYVNDGTGDQALTPAALTWSSTNAISNKTAQAWHLRPSVGP